MRQYLFFIASLLLSAGALASEPKSQNLDELLKKVLSERVFQFKELQEREKQFLKTKEGQQKKLVQARRELQSLERQSKLLVQKFEEQEKQLSKIEERLNFATGTLGELFGVVRQVAGDFTAHLQNSITSAHIKDRVPFLRKMAKVKSLPNIPHLERLWFELQREMTESGKVLFFKSYVVLANGKKVKQSLVRIGSFNLVSEGKYFVYQPKNKQIIELARQPSGRLLSLVEDFLTSKASFAPVSIDPSRGVILSALVQAPTLSERVRQGGIVGYIILVLLFIGLCLSAERFFVLHREKKYIQKQLLKKQPLEGNTLGSIMQIFDKYRSTDLDTLELKLEETVINHNARLSRGISTLKVLAGIAPLLGLLGTVTGMIATFQAITLFGTGDPKLMAGGISQALVTTVLGLVCAIPLLLLYNLVFSKFQSIMQILEEQSLGMLARRLSDNEKT